MQSLVSQKNMLDMLDMLDYFCNFTPENTFSKTPYYAKEYS